MPPKNKGANKKSAKAKLPTLIDGLTKDELSKEQMVDHIVRLQEELDREREERNYFQLERDKIHNFWEVTQRQLGEVVAQLKNLDRDIERDERCHQEEIMVFKQKMKHLLCEHQNMIAELKADGLRSNTAAKTEQAQLEGELQKRMRGIRVDMEALHIENLVRDLEQTHDEEMTKTRSSLENQLTEFQAESEKRLDVLQRELDNKRRHTVIEQEDEWNGQITRQKKDHDRVFSDATALLNRQVEEDVGLNDSLKKQIEDLKMRKKEKEKDLKSVLPDTKCLNDLLSGVTKETNDIKKKIKYPTGKKDPREKVKLQELKDQNRDIEALRQKLSALQLERDELYETFTPTVQTAQQHADLKNLPMEKEVKTLTEGLEKTQAQLSSLLSAPHLDQTALGEVTQKVQDIIDSRNQSIRDLQHRRACISKARRDLLLHQEAKQRTQGFRADEQSLTRNQNSVTVATLAVSK